MMRSIAIGLVIVACGSTASAQEVIRDLSWSELKKTGGVIVGEIQPGGSSGSREQLKIGNPSGEPRTIRNAWWTEQTAGLIGGIGGSICGILGAMIGILGGIGKARRFVLTLTAALIVFGVACLVLGVIAWSLGQPYGVYYLLLLGGIILTAVCGGNLPNLRRRYEQIELRKMAAMDAP
ncbi:MAG: hypothetical protein ACLQNE_37640 [Thermoguttaceae bacterium]